MSTLIESLGVYLPPNVLTSDEIVKGCKLGLPIPLERLTGIRSRRVASPGQASLDLAREAALACLARSKYEPADIDVLICCSISKAQTSTAALIEPMLSFYLQQALGMQNALAFDITNACAGLFTGVAIADAFLKAGDARRVMVVAGEWSSYVIYGAQLEIAEPGGPAHPVPDGRGRRGGDDPGDLARSRGSGSRRSTCTRSGSTATSASSSRPKGSTAA